MAIKGATRHQPPKKRIWSDSNTRYLKPISIAVTVISFFVAVILLSLQFVNKDIKELVLVAPFEHVSESQVRLSLQGVFPNGFIYLDISEVKNRLMLMPMVAQVEVEKVWPETLKITIQEEQPVAIWNAKNMLSHSGNVLPLALAELRLPKLQGSEGESRLVMQHFQLFSHWGKRHQLNLTGLSNSTSGWLLSFEDQVGIWLDSTRAMQGLQQLERVLQQFKINRIQRIDMRYEQGFAVAWKEKTQSVPNIKGTII